MADNLETFEMTRPFHKFTAEDYNQWKAKRMQDPRPLRQCEPVAFFEFDERPSITIDIDFKKSCRYIMLKPTGFRSKPHHFRQSVNDLPMELEFFGVLGTTQPSDSSSDFCGAGDLASSKRHDESSILSGHAIVIKDLETDEELLRLDSLPISHLRICNMPLDRQRALWATGVSQIGQSVLRLSDQRISLRTLGGLSVRVSKVGTGGAWELRGASIVGVVTQAGQIPPLYRSYLISPKYFGAINRVLSAMVFDGKYDKALTSYIMEFLTKLIRNDYQFAALILDTLDLRQFITVNLLTNDQAHIQASVEFLRCFQTESKFVRDLYEILIDIVQNELPQSVPPQRGYEALVGMLNWVMPLDMERTLRALIATFYSKVGKRCVPEVQTPEYVEFRTRYSTELQGDSRAATNFSEHYPFDQVLLRPLSIEEGSRSDSGPQDKEEDTEEGSATARRWGLLRGVVIHSERQSMSHTFKATFANEAVVKLVQIYFSDQQSALYKLDVLVSVGNKLVFHQSMNESSFARYVRYKRSGQSQKESGECKPTPDECLSLALSCRCSELTVKLIFGYTSTSLPTKAHKESAAPATLAEFYGDLVAPGDQEAVQKGHQAKVEEYQKQAAKLVRVGKSVQMLTLPVAARPKETKMIPFCVEKKSSLLTPRISSPKQESKQAQQAKDPVSEQREVTTGKTVVHSGPLELDEV